MKKKILGLALALIMIISLLPLTALAEDSAKVKLYIYTPSSITFESTAASSYFTSRVCYFVIEDNPSTEADAPAKIMVKKQVAASEAPTDNYLRVEYAVTDGEGLYTMQFKNFDTTGISMADSGTMFQIAYSNTSQFDTVISLEGNNVITTGADIFVFKNNGDVTITGPGSLRMHTTRGENDLFYMAGAGNLTIKDTTITGFIDTAEFSGSVGLCNAFTVNGNVTIENSTLDLTVNNGAGIKTATKRNATALANSVTIKNSDVKILQGSGQEPLISNSTGTTTIENSNVELMANVNNSKVLPAAPTITGTYSSQKYSIWQAGDSKYQETDYTAAAFDSNIRWLKLVHQCVALADDGDCTTAVKCACGKEAVAAKTHIAGANADDCTKDTLCGNAGCTQVFEAATATAHTPAADDGDCTTAVKCTNCQQDAIPAAAAHSGGTATCTEKAKCATCGKEYGEKAPHQPKAGTYPCTDAHPCANCTGNYREAGQHIGGTATCKDKAVCTNCNTAYGELAACTPAADDGDCTTDIKCSICGKTTTAGEAAHKYTDKADTTCDNAGCTKTRVVEGDENPKTGDNTAIIVMAALMVTAAAAFVTTKKFAR